MEAIGGTGLKVCSSLYADRHLRRRSFLTWGAPSLFSLARETLLVPPLSPKLLLTCAGGQVRPYGPSLSLPGLCGRTSPPLRWNWDDSRVPKSAPTVELGRQPRSRLTAAFQVGREALSAPSSIAFIPPKTLTTIIGKRMRDQGWKARFRRPRRNNRPAMSLRVTARKTIRSITDCHRIIARGVLPISERTCERHANRAVVTW